MRERERVTKYYITKETRYETTYVFDLNILYTSKQIYKRARNKFWQLTGSSPDDNKSKTVVTWLQLII